MTRQTKRKQQDPASFRVSLEYYHLPFNKFHLQLRDFETELSSPHVLRTFYWAVTSSGRYPPRLGRQLIELYRTSVERQLARQISRHSLAYWLHAYRRLLPAAIGENDETMTTLIVRAGLESAIQKYSLLHPCEGIAVSNEVAPEAILRGELMSREFEVLRKFLAEKPQLVLTQFGTSELLELYQCEKLAYEIWQCGATQRIMGKGADLVVDGSKFPPFIDDRGPQLDRLVTIYDRRPHGFASSATGTAYSDELRAFERAGAVFVPQYNAKKIPAKRFEGAFKRWGLIFVNDDFITNFLWFPMNLRGYYKAHLPFSNAFAHKHRVTYDSVMVVVAALLYRVFWLWIEKKEEAVVHYWQRAYEGPLDRSLLVREIGLFVPMARQLLQCEVPEAEIDTEGAVRFLELSSDNRGVVDVLVGAPLRVILPFDRERVFVDLAWISTVLYNLFFGLEVSDQNFKGAALEELARGSNPPLPHHQIRSKMGEARQVDASFAVADTLVIAECRAFGRSFGITKGDPKAYEYRRQRIDAALKASDEKGHWLAANPIGTNYDISRFTKILPVAITPFSEYIHSLDRYYWLTDNLPRVLTIGELKQALGDGTIGTVAAVGQNVIRVHRDG